MKYIIFGHKGQLGRAFINLLDSKKIEWLGYDYPDYDICDYVMVNHLIEQHLPDVVINCAAYSNVEGCELNTTKAYSINLGGVSNLAVICKNWNVKLVHYSTDYVFDGLRYTPGMYKESDRTTPINYYGLTKLKGEESALAANSDMLIFRTSWLYGDGTNNFHHNLNQWSSSSKILKIVNDEISIPTSTLLVSRTTLQAINSNLTGLYHLTCTGYCSRYDWAKTYFDFMDRSIIIYPCSSKDIHSIVKRPPFSALDNSKICNALQIELPYWKDELLYYLKLQTAAQLQQQPNIKRIRDGLGVINLKDENFF